MGVYQTIINQIPPHRVKIEAFGGSAAISRFTRPAEVNLIIELDPAVARSTADAIGCEVLPGSVDINNCIDEAVKCIYPGSRQRTAVICGCAISLLSNLKLKGDEFIYLDPPYLLESRSHKKALIYEREFSDLQHLQLLKLLKRFRCPVMISGYRSSLYEQVLEGWRVLTYQAITRNGTQATEYLWMNYPEPVELHDYRYLGRDKTERQRIKRKTERWQKKLQNMPLLERQAVLAAIQEMKR
jgi:16S rRNA G966 N2-methylase RsmD